MFNSALDLFIVLHLKILAIGAYPFPKPLIYPSLFISFMQCLIAQIQFLLELNYYILLTFAWIGHAIITANLISSQINHSFYSFCLKPVAV